MVRRVRRRLYPEIHPCLAEYTGRNAPISECPHNLQITGDRSATTARMRGVPVAEWLATRGR